MSIIRDVQPPAVQTQDVASLERLLADSQRRADEATARIQDAMLRDIPEARIAAYLRSCGWVVVGPQDVAAVLPAEYPPLADNDPICDTCMRVHNRDTSAPIRCPTCQQIIGCLWHNRNAAHTRACKQRPLLE